MDRQALSPEFLEHLQDLNPRPKRRGRQWAALAACCALLAGLGWHLSRPVETLPVRISEASQSVLPKEEKIVLPRLSFQDNSAQRVLEDAAPAPALAPAPVEGVMQYEILHREDVAQALFGGEIPEVLGWGDFEITGSTGEKGAASWSVSGAAGDFAFDLAVQEGEIPDLAAEGGEVTRFRGVEIFGVKQAEDLYEISFLTPEGIGIFYRVKGGDGPERTAALAWALLARKGA